MYTTYFLCTFCDHETVLFLLKLENTSFSFSFYDSNEPLRITVPKNSTKVIFPSFVSKWLRKIPITWEHCAILLLQKAFSHNNTASVKVIK